MGKRRRRKRKNYIVLGIKGFFKLIWVGITYIGLGFYYIGQGIGWCVHKLARMVRPAKIPEYETVPTQKEEETLDSEETTKTKSKSASRTAPNKAASHVQNIAPEEVEEIPAIFEEITHSEESESFEHAINSLYKKSRIALIFGKRGSGKSTLGFRIMENAHAKHARPCFVLGVKQDVLPEWIESVNDIDHVRNGGIVLVDEGAVSFSARQSMNKGNVGLGKLLAIARHKDLAVLFITQNTGMIDKNVLNLTDLIIAKEGSLLQKKMERAEVREFVEKADKQIKTLPRADRIKHAYLFSDEFEGLIFVPMPSFWSTKISKNQN